MYHALATDMYDAADMSPGPHQGTFATERKDGHGRTVLTTERFHANGLIASRQTQVGYLPTNETEIITRSHPGSADPPVVRWMRYDSLGRMVLNAEPNTSKNFSPDPNTDPEPGVGKLEAWRYAYNDAGDLVATSDARGCGVNFAYDGAGRLTSEDYSPCTGEQADYSAPTVNAAAGPTGAEVLYFYDSAPTEPYPGLQRPQALTVLSQDFFKGRLVAVWDRASETWTNFDGRGRPTESHVRLAKPGTPADALPDRYAPRPYVKKTVFDSADRVLATTTGATTTELAGSLDPLTGATNAITTAYSARGTLQAVAGSYGSLVGRVERSADGLLQSIEYGDVAKTKTGFSYDLRRRLKSVQTYRGPPPSWTAPPADYQPPPSFGSDHLPTFQFLLQDDDFTYDVVSNPTEIRDWRVADEWPSGAKPVTRKIQYDDLYRAARVDYQYSAGDDNWTSPFDAEDSGDPTLDDPRRDKPSPHVTFDKRVVRQDFSYDWLGNTASTDDDAHGFYDRSLGSIANAAASGKPYQLSAADNVAAGGTRTGSLTTAYDDAGNLTELRLKRAGTCLPAGSQCSQIFSYAWDEVGRLARASRWDVSATEVGAPGDPPPTADPVITLSYAYDAGDQRVLKTATPATGSEHTTAYIFDSLELRRALWTASGGPTDDADYELTPLTEVAYLFANGVRLARLAYEPPDPDNQEPVVPTIGSAHLHVFFELGDHLGSNSVVLDKATSELVERSTYQAYGAAESDYRPARWKAFREDYKFTGKEEDIDVGLTYFGKRYLSPYLNRWISADPLAVHVPGEADLNVYAYVRGAPLKNIDPRGLQEAPGAGGSSGMSPSGGFEGGGGVDNATDNNVGVKAPEGCGQNMSCGPGDAVAVAPPGLGIDPGPSFPRPPPGTFRPPPVSTPPPAPVIPPVEPPPVLPFVARAGLVGLAGAAGFGVGWAIAPYVFDVLMPSNKAEVEAGLQALNNKQTAPSSSGRTTSPAQAPAAGLSGSGGDESDGGGARRDAGAPKFKVPKSGSGAARATDVPSWARGNRPMVGENGRQFAERLCNEKYGPDEYPKGPGSEYNKIRKWGDRGFQDP